jgi:hypothetical protein
MMEVACCGDVAVRSYQATSVIFADAASARHEKCDARSWVRDFAPVAAICLLLLTIDVGSEDLSGQKLRTPRVK